MMIKCSLYDEQMYAARERDTDSSRLSITEGTEKRASDFGDKAQFEFREYLIEILT